LEITENVVLHRSKGDILATLQRLNGIGVGLAWDDFGTGYSSLTHLRNLPVQEIKVDRSFVRALETNKDDAAIVRGVIELAHRLGLRTIAEGVETAEQAMLLSDFGCDLAQGYYFGRPVPADSMGALLRDHSPSRRMPRLATAS
jgi:EAL domain-containing protein (putative c-di-GMP-specific phosphodiesterase class I)